MFKMYDTGIIIAYPMAEILVKEMEGRIDFERTSQSLYRIL